jgi:RIO-like serine/threonine protein kinase
VEKKIMSAFDEIHGLGVVHGDIRTANILVGNDTTVWIVDFEFSHAVADGNAGARLLSDERLAVLEMLRHLKEENGGDFEINSSRD